MKLPRGFHLYSTEQKESWCAQQKPMLVRSVCNSWDVIDRMERVGFVQRMGRNSWQAVICAHLRPSGTNGCIGDAFASRHEAEFELRLALGLPQRKALSTTVPKEA